MKLCMSFQKIQLHSWWLFLKNKTDVSHTDLQVNIHQDLINIFCLNWISNIFQQAPAFDVTCVQFAIYDAAVSIPCKCSTCFVFILQTFPLVYFELKDLKLLHHWYDKIKYIDHVVNDWETNFYHSEGTNKYTLMINDQFLLSSYHFQ